MIIKEKELIDGQEIEFTGEIIVSPNQRPERLDQYLANTIEKISRAQVQKLIKHGKITVNNLVAKPSYTINGGERIIIRFPRPPKPEILPENIPLEIIYEDEYLLVLNKKAGMVVHPACGNLTGTLANALAYHSQNLSTLSGEFRPGLVHRLDKDTSGLLVIAKNDYVHGELSGQFAAHTVQREYRAIVWGHFVKKSGRIESYLKRSERDRTLFVSSLEGKLAITNYEVLASYPLVSLLKLRLETGRTHQIRVHMAWQNHPVFGDQTYGGRHKQTIQLNQQERELALHLLALMPRQALHAKTLGFIHPETHQNMMFDSELPEDMQRLLQYLDGQQGHC